MTVQAIFLHNFDVLVVCTHSAFLRCVHQEMGSSMNSHGTEFLFCSYFVDSFRFWRRCNSLDRECSLAFGLYSSLRYPVLRET